MREIAPGLPFGAVLRSNINYRVWIAIQGPSTPQCAKSRPDCPLERACARTLRSASELRFWARVRRNRAQITILSSKARKRVWSAILGANVRNRAQIVILNAPALHCRESRLNHDYGRASAAMREIALALLF